jgi:hypothetical protein
VDKVYVCMLQRLPPATKNELPASPGMKKPKSSARLWSRSLLASITVGPATKSSGAVCPGAVACADEDEEEEEELSKSKNNPAAVNPPV